VAAQYDLLLKGGTVIDPSQGLQQRCDVAFRDGRVAALVPDLPIGSSAECHRRERVPGDAWST
jgi:dihydroorotase